MGVIIISFFMIVTNGDGNHNTIYNSVLTVLYAGCLCFSVSLSPTKNITFLNIHFGASKLNFVKNYGGEMCLLQDDR